MLLLHVVGGELGASAQSYAGLIDFIPLLLIGVVLFQ